MSARAEPREAERAVAAAPSAARSATAPYRFEPEIESASRDALAALQLRRLRATLRRAYAHVPATRAKFDSAGANPADLRTLADLRRFPFTVKDDLRAAYPFGLFAVPRERLSRVHASSGTTGRPTVVGYTRGDLARWAGLMARSFAAAGARPGDMIHNAYGYGLFTGGLGAHDGAQRLGATVVPASGGGTERQIVLLRDFAADVLCATPSYALNIAEVAEREGVDLRGGRLRLGLFGAEPWSEGMRSELERRLGLRACDVYGLSEIMGPGVAVECEARQGLHGWEDHFLFEVIDPATGAALAPGEEGELVITTLTKEAMPLIRYRTRDITRLETARCACGRNHVRIMRIAGRDDDMMIIRGVNVYPSQIEAALTGVAGTSANYRLVRERKGALETLTIQFEPAPGLAAAAWSDLAQRIVRQVKSLIGVTVAAEPCPPGALPRSAGKAARVRDLRPKA